MGGQRKSSVGDEVGKFSHKGDIVLGFEGRIGVCQVENGGILV